MDLLDPTVIRSELADSAFIKDIRWFDETDSTNTQALNLAMTGAPEGTVVLAETQHGGRGRQGRVWLSPPGKNLYLSLILRPGSWQGHLGLLAFVGGLAIADVLEGAYGLPASLKWPNDVLVHGQKISGVLVETARGGDGGLAVIVGIGVNINMEALDFPLELAGRATSIALHLGFQTDRSVFAGRLLQTLGNRYRTHASSGPRSVVQAWKARATTLGRKVNIHSAGGNISGQAVDVTEDGFLVIRAEDGQAHVVMAGDVELA